MKIKNVSISHLITLPDNQPNFVPREGATKGLTLKTALDEYDEDARKQFRGMIEGFWGGIATRQGTTCRFKNHQSKTIFGHALALAQQVRTYLRFKVLTFSLSDFRTNPQSYAAPVKMSQHIASFSEEP